MRIKFPPLLMTSDPGSYARLTILERKPTIIAQVIADHSYSEAVLANLAQLKHEIATQEIQPLLENSSDSTFWNESVAYYSGHTWLNLPWYFAETFFYRKLLAATRYFHPGATFHQDPFLPGKLKSLSQDIPWFEEELLLFAQIPEDQQFTALFHACLWGNRADLSNFTVKEQVRSGFNSPRALDELLIDHTGEVKAILSHGCERLDWISDNIGKEQLLDLATADTILSHFPCGQIVLHLKDRPFFVSDSTIEDTMMAIERLQNATPGITRQLGDRLKGHITTGRIKLSSDPFYTSCFMFRQLPDRLRHALAFSNLVVIKGDVNYRRLIDDCHWPYTTRMESITSYFPAPFVALRTLKGEIMVDLLDGQAEEIARVDPDWLIDGKRGIIRFVNPRVSA